MSKKILVAYFSASGVTAKAAWKLSEAAGADLYEIKPKVPYSSADLDWTNKKSRSSVEMNDPIFRPEIAGKLEGMDQYDLVFVGFPIWWYVAPTIINTFLESYDFSGKTIVPFATSGGSSMGNTNEKLAPSCPGAILMKGKMLSGSLSQEELKAWVTACEKVECRIFTASHDVFPCRLWFAKIRRSFNVGNKLYRKCDRIKI